MIGNAADAVTLAIQVACDGRQIGIKLRTNIDVEDGRTILGAEHHVDQQEGKGLRHGSDDGTGFQP